MRTDEYVPGYGASMLEFMARHSAEVQAGFFLPHLKPGMDLLDAGCGPGSITLGLARAVAPGKVTGVDIEDSQFEQARAAAEREQLNVEFRKASVYELPFTDQQFDAVFSHAVLESLSDPTQAMAEFRRVLKPGGVIGLRAGDLGGLLLDADSDGPAQAFAAYLAQQKQSAKDPNIGRKLSRLLRKSGFAVDKVTASYEVVSDAIMKLLASQFAHPGSFCKLQDRTEDSSIFVALAWCEATGHAV
jgi:ubiquinone/menaquinone biosynthesis C-methylase UbiE